MSLRWDCISRPRPNEDKESGYHRCLNPPALAAVHHAELHGRRSCCPMASMLMAYRDSGDWQCHDTQSPEHNFLLIDHLILSRRISRVHTEVGPEKKSLHRSGDAHACPYQVGTSSTEPGLTSHETNIELLATK